MLFCFVLFNFFVSVENWATYLQLRWRNSVLFILVKPECWDHCIAWTESLLRLLAETCVASNWVWRTIVMWNPKLKIYCEDKYIMCLEMRHKESAKMISTESRFRLIYDLTRSYRRLKCFLLVLLQVMHRRILFLRYQFIFWEGKQKQATSKMAKKIHSANYRKGFDTGW